MNFLRSPRLSVHSVWLTNTISPYALVCLSQRCAARLYWCSRSQKEERQAHTKQSPSVENICKRTVQNATHRSNREDRARPYHTTFEVRNTKKLEILIFRELKVRKFEKIVRIVRPRDNRTPEDRARPQKCENSRKIAKKNFYLWSWKGKWTFPVLKEAPRPRSRVREPRKTHSGDKWREKSIGKWIKHWSQCRENQEKSENSNRKWHSANERASATSQCPRKVAQRAKFRKNPKKIQKIIRF